MRVTVSMIRQQSLLFQLIPGPDVPIYEPSDGQQLELLPFETPFENQLKVQLQY